MIYFSIFNCLVSISWGCVGCQRLFMARKHFRRDATEWIENFGKMLNRTKYRYERRGYYTFAQQRAKRLADGCSFTICQPLFCQLYCQSGGQGVASGSPLLRKGIIAASGYLAQMWAQAPVCICPLWRAWHNTLDFAGKVVCHETPARFL